MNGTLHVFEFLGNPVDDNPPPKGLCTVFGGERFLKRLAVDHLTSSVAGDDSEFAVTNLDPDNASWADVHDELATRSLFGGGQSRIVLIDHADKFVKEYREQLESLVAGGAESGLLVLVVDSWASNTRLYKAVNQHGLQIRCDAPTKSARSKQRDDQQVKNWLVDRASSEYHYRLPAGGAQLLIELTDCEFGRMDQELQKLALYVDKRGKVDSETIRKVVGGWRTRTMWDAIDAASSGDAAKALGLLDQLIRSGEHPLALFGQLSWSLRRYPVATDVVKRQMRNGRKPDLPSALKEAGFRSWGGELTASESRIKQLGRHRAAAMMDWLLEADLALKRTHSQEDRGRLMLEMLFVKMAEGLK